MEVLKTDDGRKVIIDLGTDRSEAKLEIRSGDEFVATTFGHLIWLLRCVATGPEVTRGKVAPCEGGVDGGTRVDSDVDNGGAHIASGGSARDDNEKVTDGKNRPCPFCGSNVLYESYHTVDWFDMPFMFCNSCKAMFTVEGSEDWVTDESDGMDKLRAAWDRRAE